MNRKLIRSWRRVALFLLPFWLCLAYATPVAAQPTVTKTWSLETDGNSNGLVDAGDTIKYTVQIGAATNVVFADPVPDTNTTLVVGSVTCVGGDLNNVISGNTAGNTQVGVQVGTVAVATTATITFKVTVVNPLPGGIVQVVNQGGVSCDTCGSSGVLTNLTVTPVNNFAALSVEKTAALKVDADLNSVISPGDTLKYTVVIANTSSDHTAGGVVFADSIPDPSTHLVATSVTTTQGSVTTGNGASDTTVAVDVGTLSPGGSATITFQVVIANPVPAGVNQIVDQGQAGCINCSPQAVPTDDPSTGTVGDPTITPVVAAPKLTVTKTAALQTDADLDTKISPGDTLRYTVTITNSGNQDAAAVFSDPVPDPHTTLVVGSVTKTQGTVLSGNTLGDTTVAVDLGSVPGVISSANGVATVTFDVKIKNPLPAFVNQVVNQGGVSCGNCTPPGQPSDDPSTGTVGDPTITPVVAAPKLTVTKTAALQTDADLDTKISPGDTLRYTVTITNSGNQDAAAVFSDPVPDPHTTLVVGSVTKTQGTVLTGNTGGDTSVAVDLGSVPGVTGSGNGVATVTFDVTIKNPLPAFVNQVVNQGGVSCGNCTPPGQPSDDPNTSTVGDPTITPVVAAPVITATKFVELLVDQNHDGQVNPSDILKYTIVVTNSGNQDAAGVQILDPPAPFAGSPYTNFIAGSVTTNLGTIIAGNNPGDPLAGVQIPVLGGLGGSATITLQMQVKNTVIGNVTILNHGTVTGGNFAQTLTNTTAIAAFGPVPVPTLSQLGLVLLIMLLAGVAVLGLWGRSADRPAR